MKLSIVTTIYRTAKCIEEFHRRCVTVAERMQLELETIFVNDGSPDDGLHVAGELAKRDHRVVVVDLSRNFGQFGALWAGIEQATGDFVAIMDGDLDDDPLWLGDFYHRMIEGGWDVVYGIEPKSRRALPYRAGRRLFYFALNRLSSVPFPENVLNARLMRRRYVNALLEFPEREIYLAGLMHAAGFAQAGVEVTRRERSRTKYSFLKLVRIFVNSVTSFSIRPLLFIFGLGLALSAFAGLYFLVLIYRKLVYGIDIEGYASVMGAILLFSGIIIFFNGVMAIYIGTIFLEVKGRPRALIRDVIRDGKSTNFTYIR
ncbi:MAG TPA: glycosyltransferase family 2 protein [Micropepsaceae bacterium]|nr:glycosyltransferase family 2 protein [Micropepsaceae bacterium]